MYRHFLNSIRIAILLIPLIKDNMKILLINPLTLEDSMVNITPNLGLGYLATSLRNNEFDVENAILSYYRQPVRIEIQNCVDPYTSQVSLADVECEFKDDIIELIIDEAVSILAGDIESGNQFSRNQDSAERSN